MTDEQLRIKVAELVGWEPEILDVCHTVGHIHHELSEMPDYLNDLNAMHEAEHLLRDDDWDGIGEYLAHLRRAMNIGCDEWRLPFATARQRAEAFVAVMQGGKE